MYEILDRNTRRVSRHRSLEKAEQVAVVQDTDTNLLFIADPSGNLIRLIYCGGIWYPNPPSTAPAAPQG